MPRKNKRIRNSDNKTYQLDSFRKWAERIIKEGKKNEGKDKSLTET